MTLTPSDLDVQSAALERALGQLHTCMPGEIVRIHAGAHGRQFVDVLPGLQRCATTEDEEDVPESLPVLPMVPVGYYQGGGFFISVPLAVGDIVLLVFAERSLDQWIQTARKGGQRAIDPGDLSTHSLEGAVAIPCGPAPRANLLQNVDATDLVIGNANGIALRVTAASGGSLDGVALAAKVATELDRIKQDITTLKNAVKTGLNAVGAGTAANGPGAATTFDGLVGSIPSSPASVAATTVKAR